MSGTIKNIAVYTLGSILADVASIAMVPVYLRVLPPEEMGWLDTCMTVSLLLAVLASAGIEASILRVFFDYKTLAEQKRLAGNAVFLAAIGSVGVGIPAWTCGRELATWITGEVVSEKLILSLVVFFLLQGVFMVARSILRVHERAVVFVCGSLVTAVVGVGAACYGVLVLKGGAESVLLGRALGLFCGVVVLAVPVAGLVTFRPDKRMVRAILSYGIPLLGTSIVMWVVSNIERVLQPRLVGLAELGVYAIGLRFAGIIRFISDGVRLAWPTYAYGNLDGGVDEKRYGKALKAYVAAMLVVGSVISVYVGDVIEILNSYEYEKVQYYVPIFIIMYISMGAVNMVNVGIHIKKKTNALFVISLISAIVKIGFTIGFGMTFGGIGIAIGSMISFLLTDFMIVWISNRMITINYPYRGIFNMLFCFSLLTAAALALSDLGLGYRIFLRSVLLVLFWYVVYKCAEGEVLVLLKLSVSRLRRAS